MVLLYTHGAYRNICYVEDEDAWMSLERGPLPINPFIINTIVGACITLPNLKAVEEITTAKNRQCIGSGCNKLIEDAKERAEKINSKSEFGITCELNDLIPLEKLEDDDDDEDDIRTGMPDKIIGPNNVIPDGKYDLDDLNICTIIGTITLKKSIHDFFPEHIFLNEDFNKYCKLIFLKTIILLKKPLYNTNNDIALTRIINKTVSNHKIPEIVSTKIDNIFIDDVSLINIENYEELENFYNYFIIFEPNENLFNSMLLTIYQYLYTRNKLTDYNNDNDKTLFETLIGLKVVNKTENEQRLSKKHIEFYEKKYDDLFISDSNRKYEKEDIQIIIPEWTWGGIDTYIVGFYCNTLHKTEEGKILLSFQIAAEYNLSTIVNFCDNKKSCYFVDATCSISLHSHILSENKLTDNDSISTLNASQIFGGTKKTKKTKTKKTKTKKTKTKKNRKTRKIKLILY